MGLLLFYHLTRSPLPDTIGLIAGRALDRDWRVMVRGTDAARLAGLDAALWLVPAPEFLPHGVTGVAQDADQPVLLGKGAASNGARALMLVDGAAVTDAEIAAMERVWVFFDGNDEAAVADARAQWLTLTRAGHAAQYWGEEGGRWQMKAEHPKPGAENP